MKLILLVIINIIIFNSISSKNIKCPIIFKGRIVRPIDKGANKISYFMACCIKGGLNSKEQILKAHNWALKNNIIRKDNFETLKCNDLAKKVSDEFKTAYHSEWKVRGSSKRGIFDVFDAKNKIIFDYTWTEKQLKEKGILIK